MSKTIIKPSEHVGIFGRTGTGKTVLAKLYSQSIPNVIVLDTKGTFVWEGVGEIPVFERLADLMKFQEGKAIYRPIHSEMTKEFYERFFEWIYIRKNTTVLVDELMSFATNTYCPEYLKAILTRGRERNTNAFLCTQRPKTIPLVCISELTHFFVFSLNVEDDRKRIMEVVGAKEFLQIPPKHYFWYYNVEMDRPYMATLKIKK